MGYFLEYQHSPSIKGNPLQMSKNCKTFSIDTTLQAYIQPLQFGTKANRQLLCTQQTAVLHLKAVVLFPTSVHKL